MSSEAEGLGPPPSASKVTVSPRVARGSAGRERLPEHRLHSCYELFGERVVSIFNSISHYVFAQPPIGQSDHAVPEGDDGHIPHLSLGW